MVTTDLLIFFFQVAYSTGRLFSRLEPVIKQAVIYSGAIIISSCCPPLLVLGFPCAVQLLLESGSAGGLQNSMW